MKTPKCKFVEKINNYNDKGHLNNQVNIYCKDVFIQPFKLKQTLENKIKLPENQRKEMPNGINDLIFLVVNKGQ